MSIRTLGLCAIALFSVPAFGQLVQGRLDPRFQGVWVVLLGTHGSSHYPLDSVKAGRDGSFAFNTKLPGAGFYQLAVNDTDRVDLILDPREKVVEVDIPGTPLQQHIQVRRSAENQRLWRYKLISKEVQAVRAAVAQEKLTLQPTDTDRLTALDSVLQRAESGKQDLLGSILRDDPESYFAFAIRTDQALEGTPGKGPMAVAAAFDFGDPRLLRSAVYDRAVMTFLQNLNAVTEEQFVVASDTLMVLAGRDADCRAYMLEHLLDLFTTYGPDLASQHLVDRYVAPLGSTAAFSPVLKAKVEAMLKVAVGATGYDVNLNDHGTMRPLSDLIRGAQRTVLFFYSSTCDHCHAQMPGLKELHASHPDPSLRIIGIALDTDSAEFKKCIAENGLPWRAFSEFNGWGSTVAKVYQVKATPAFIVLDPQRRILAKPVDAADLANKLDQLH
jgi:peroxiredoxin